MFRIIRVRQKFVHPLRTTIPNNREYIVHLHRQPITIALKEGIMVLVSNWIWRATCVPSISYMRMRRYIYKRILGEI